MICLIQNIEDYNNDLRVMLMAFYPGVKIVTPENIEKKPELKQEIAFVFKADFEETRIKLCIFDSSMDIEKALETLNSVRSETLLGSGVTRRILICDYKDKARTRNPLKLAMYQMLKERTGKSLPWGCLTGVRPTKIAMEAIEHGKDDQEVLELYQDTYGASLEKARICVEVAHREKQLIDSIDEAQEYCLYVGIPFCPSRCLYCSFTSYPIALYKDRVKDYLDALEKEIIYTSQAYAHKKLVSVYIGGGTPSSIEADALDRLCGMLEQAFDMRNVREFTVEAGRPDSITVEKLQVMKQHKVTRISINPQTMNDETLRVIGRAHTSAQTVEAFRLAREAGFNNINMDLIVGLPEENAASVEHTMRQIRKLAPESLTVHSLAIKRAANLNQEMDKYRDKLAQDIEKQLHIVTENAAEMGLKPYYLYRQKNIAGNLENIGFSKPGMECVYNILIMEERTDIIGLGAGSSSKLIKKNRREEMLVNPHQKGTRIDRIENVKSVDDYIARIDEMIDRKKIGFEVSYYEHDMEDAIRHGMCVSKLAAAVAALMGLDAETVHTIAVAGMLHDVGKLQISPYIYGRQKNTMRIEEMQYMRLHAKLGADIVEKKGYGPEIVEMILYHHENYDGSGYPFHLSGDAIPLGARIIRVCDVFVALISDRPYRGAFDADAALAMQIDEVRHFDMKVFLVFQRLINTGNILEELMQILHDKLPGI